MALQLVAIMAAIAAAEKFCQIGLVKRLLQNWSHGTHNTIDDWVVVALTDSDPTVVEKKLEAAQSTYNGLGEDAKTKLKESVPLPDEVLEILTSETVARMLPGVRE